MTSNAMIWVDENAVTLRLPAVPRARSFARRVRIGGAVSLASLAASIWIFAGRHEVSAGEFAGATPVPAASVALARAPRPVEPVLASGTFAFPDAFSESDQSRDVDDEIVILDDEDDDGVILLPEQEPAPAPVRPAGRTAGRAQAREVAFALVRQAEAARSVGDTQAQRRALEAALAALPSYGPAAAALAELHMTRGEYGSALRLAKRAARSAPRKLSYMILLGDAYDRTEKRAAARKVWRRASAYGSSDAKARLEAIRPAPDSVRTRGPGAAPG